jgi:hypothetical protein
VRCQNRAYPKRGVEPNNQGGQGMGTLAMNRRRFLETSSHLAVGAAAMAAAGGAAVVAPHGAWAATRIISPSQAATLVVMARHLFPHDALGDRYYAAAVESLDEKAAGDPDLAGQLVEGVAKLDESMGIPFLKLSSGNQLKVIEALEGTPFFNSVRSATLGALYTNDVVARNFGFEGSSVEYGGYIERGFNDLGWLPALPDNA